MNTELNQGEQAQKIAQALSTLDSRSQDIKRKSRFLRRIDWQWEMMSAICVFGMMIPVLCSMTLDRKVPWYASILVFGCVWFSTLGRKVRTLENQIETLKELIEKQNDPNA